ncbi:tyrosine-type recombinase/integrase [Corynebacterium comes]|uniref:tyrosine-type recombinase/integrase n=1 Tax=Corynebacterium comes TaxID=2675218 RepID=UPI0012E201CA|nr:site-specific integrase [Corynebacterium comes]
MGNTQPYTLASGQRRWEHRYRRPDGTDTRKRGFQTKRDAERWAAVNAVSLDTGTWTDRSLGRQTVAEAARKWLTVKTPALAPKTALQYSHAVDHICKTGRLGGVPLGKVRAATIEEWLAALAATGLSAKSIRTYAQPLSQVLDRAVRDGRIPASPFHEVSLPRVARTEMIVPTPEGVALAAEAAGAYGPVIEFLAQSGLRWSEMAGLQVRDVALDRRRIYVRRQLFEVGGKLQEGPPKHGKQRVVPTTDRVVGLLREQTRGRAPTDLVWTTMRGAPLRNGNARKQWWNQAVAAAGHPGWTPHVLRHYFASTAISAGASIKALGSVMGHSSEAFCLRQYGWLMRDDLDSFVDDLSRRFSGGGQSEATGSDHGGWDLAAGPGPAKT